jgi:hypothetical protein
VIAHRAAQASADGLENLETGAMANPVSVRGFLTIGCERT